MARTWKTRKTDALKKLPSKLFRLHLPALRAGDIIASTSPDSLTSWAIRTWTRGPLSHVALVLAPDKLIEATGAGVLVNYPYLMVAEDLENVRVYRPKAHVVDFAKDQDALMKLLNAATRLIWTGYGTVKAIATAIKPLSLLATEETCFCSELVAKAYRECGITLAAGIAPERTTPREVYESSLLDDITSTVFAEVDRDPLIALHDAELRTIEGTTNKTRPLLLEIIGHTIREEAKKSGISIAEREIAGENLKIQNDFQQHVTYELTRNREARRKKVIDQAAKAGTKAVIDFYDEQIDKAARELFIKLRIADDARAGQLAVSAGYLEQAERAVHLQTHWVSHLNAEKGFLLEDGETAGTIFID